MSVEVVVNSPTFGYSQMQVKLWWKIMYIISYKPNIYYECEIMGAQTTETDFASMHQVLQGVGSGDVYI